jgi:hypothetical protein
MTYIGLLWANHMLKVAAGGTASRLGAMWAPKLMTFRCCIAIYSVAAYAILCWASGRFSRKIERAVQYLSLVHDAARPAGGERAWDEKSVARRGHGLKIAAWVIACLRRIFTAQALHRPLAGQLGFVVFGEGAKWGQSKFS